MNPVLYSVYLAYLHSKYPPLYRTVGDSWVFGDCSSVCLWIEEALFFLFSLNSCQMNGETVTDLPPGFEGCMLMTQ